MAKLSERLTDLAVKNAKPEIRSDGTIKTTLLPDGDGLYLQISAGGSPSREPDETPAAYRKRLLELMLSGTVLVSKS